MRTLGVDLSADPRKTATCLIVWTPQTVTVEVPTVGVDDDALVAAMLDADWVGIDAPFGWPRDFVAAVSAWGDGRRWPQVGRDRMRFRETDRRVAPTRLPLSVSSDRIAVTAMRCAALLTELAERRGSTIDRSGQDRVVEVYPGAALPRWSDAAAELRFDPRGYKGKGGIDKRVVLVDALGRAAPWLELDDAARSACVTNDDALDSLLASLVARAAARGLTDPPDAPEERALAAIEGWIHLPRAGTLAELPDP